MHVPVLQGLLLHVVLNLVVDLLGLGGLSTPSTDGCTKQARAVLNLARISRSTCNRITCSSTEHSTGTLVQPKTQSRRRKAVLNLSTAGQY